MTAPTPTLSATRRPLTATEKRLIRGKIRTLSSRGRRASWISLPISAAGILLLWLWTIRASDVSWPIVSLFWVLVGAAIAVWVQRDMRAVARGFDANARDLKAALERNAADVYDIRARSFAQFEEIEDEGACYAFELEDDRLVFVTGQEFYESARFPSLDFSLVYVLGDSDKPVDMFIDKRGQKTAPSRTMPRALKQALDPPEHLEVRRGRIQDLPAY
jgi:hypothetical protein